MIRLRRADLYRFDLRTRFPFRYGIATLTELPHVFLRAEFELGGGLAVGWAADHLPPRWFRKEPAQAPEDEITELQAVIAGAVERAGGLAEATPFAFWRALYSAQAAAREPWPGLLRHFGTALVERTLLSAFALAVRRPFWELLRDPTNPLGVNLGTLADELVGMAPGDFLGPPLAAVTVRHTVGLAEPLDAADGPLPSDDGLPRTLAENLSAYGLTELKVKLSGDLARDRQRLRRIGEVMAAGAPPDWRMTLDGNEQYPDAAAWAAAWRALRADPGCARALARLVFVEQPISRHRALPNEGSEAAALRAVLAESPPVVLDESDGALDDFPRALELGYAGVSHKNCKGVLKGLRNRALLALRARGGRPGLMSGEDLANLGPLALPHDLAVQAALGNASVERNGHHYFAGLAGFPVEFAREMLALHPDLYARHPTHGAVLRVREGRLDLGSVNRAPLGTTFEPAPSTRPSPARRWVFRT